MTPRRDTGLLLRVAAYLGLLLRSAFRAMRRPSADITSAAATAAVPQISERAEPPANLIASGAGEAGEPVAEPLAASEAGAASIIAAPVASAGSEQEPAGQDTALDAAGADTVGPAAPPANWDLESSAAGSAELAVPPDPPGERAGRASQEELRDETGPALAEAESPRQTEEPQEPLQAAPAIPSALRPDPADAAAPAEASAPRSDDPAGDGLSAAEAPDEPEMGLPAASAELAILPAAALQETESPAGSADTSAARDSRRGEKLEPEVSSEDASAAVANRESGVPALAVARAEPGEPAALTQPAAAGIPAPNSPVQDAEALPHAAAAPREDAPPTEPAGPAAPIRKPSRYQPRLDRPATPAPAQPRASRAAPRSAAQASLGAGLALSFRSGGWSIQIGVLLHRTPALPEQLDVRLGREEVSLWAVDERVFEVHWLTDPTSTLNDGVAAETRNGAVRWAQGARDLHVFAPRADMSDYFSTARLAPGTSNVILFREALETEVLKRLAQVGCPQPVKITATGVPAGWVGYRDIRPARSAEVAEFPGLFGALNPLASDDIELGGGVHLGHSDWLSGFPPAVLISGAEPGQVTIDGKTAIVTADGWQAPGWDEPGNHRIAYGGKSKSYTLKAAPSEWPFWIAHERGGAEVCGALVRLNGSEAFPAPLDVPCWLIGPRRGEIAACYPSSILRKDLEFEPVWAIPMAGHRPRRAPVRLSSRAMPSAARPVHSQDDAKWCAAIREAARRRPKFGDAADADLWQAYARAAQGGRHTR